MMAALSPGEAGWKMVEITQLPPAGMAAGQSLVCANSAALAPVSAMATMFNVPLPVLVGVAVLVTLTVPCCWLLNARLAGLNATLGVSTPAPLRGTLCGDPAASSATAMAALRGPVAAGLKTTDMEQVVPGARVAPHVVAEIVKSPASVPDTAIEPMFAVAVPGLLTVTVFTALPIPTVWFRNARRVGLKVIFGTPMPEPERETVCGEPGALSAMLSAAVRLPAAVGLKVRE